MDKLIINAFSVGRVQLENTESFANTMSEPVNTSSAEPNHHKMQANMQTTQPYKGWTECLYRSMPCVSPYDGDGSGCSTCRFSLMVNKSTH